MAAWDLISRRKRRREMILWFRSMSSSSDKRSISMLVTWRRLLKFSLIAEKHPTTLMILRKGTFRRGNFSRIVENRRQRVCSTLLALRPAIGSARVGSSHHSFLGAHLWNMYCREPSVPCWRFLHLSLPVL